MRPKGYSWQVFFLNMAGGVLRSGTVQRKFKLLCLSLDPQWPCNSVSVCPNCDYSIIISICHQQLLPQEHPFGIKHTGIILPHNHTKVAYISARTKNPMSTLHCNPQAGELVQISETHADISVALRSQENK